MKIFALIPMICLVFFLTSCGVFSGSEGGYSASRVRGLSFKTPPMSGHSAWVAEIPGSEVRGIFRKLTYIEKPDLTFCSGTQRGTLFLDGGKSMEIYWSRLEQGVPEFVFSIDSRYYVLTGADARDFMRVVGRYIKPSDGE